MSVSDFDSRRLATTEFLTEGLGGKLTRSADLLLRASAEDSFGDWKKSAITYACGNIVERVLWVGHGRWMGYFEDVAPISADERGLLQEYAPLLSDAKLPADVQNIRKLLMNPDALLDGSFFRRYFPDFPLHYPVPEWYPVFQAVLIASEYLTESPITSFFLFLRDGNIEKFQERGLSPDAVLKALEDDHRVYPYFGEHAWRESVVAGFIRYTEFLSAMGNIFPAVNTGPFAETPDIPTRIVDRDILYSVVKPFRWRFPSDPRALATYHTVFMAFMKLTSEEFAKYPEMGVQWSEAETYIQVIRLSQQFFGTDDRAGGQEDPMFVLERQRRSTAMASRLQELRGEGFERAR
jgi:hypothetical protein